MLRSDMDVDQIIELVKRLPDDKKQRVLHELAREAREKRAKLMEKGAASYPYIGSGAWT